MDAQNHLQNQQGVSQSHLCWSSLNMHMTFDLSEIKKTKPQGLNNNLRQSWGQTVVALVLFAVCIQLFWLLQSSPESRFYGDLGGVDIKTVALDNSYKGTGQSCSVLRRWATRLQCCTSILNPYALACNSISNSWLKKAVWSGKYTNGVDPMNSLASLFPRLSHAQMKIQEKMGRAWRILSREKWHR